MKADASTIIWLRCAVALGLYLGFFASAGDSWQTAKMIAWRISEAL